jgi:regulator of sigma E protease
VIETYLPAGTEALTDMQPGAQIVAIGDQEVEHWGDVELALVNAEPGPLTIELADPAQRVEIRVPGAEEDRILMTRSIYYWVDPVVLNVTSGSPAQEGGVEEGDTFVSVAGTPVGTWDQFVTEIKARPGQTIALGIERDGQEIVRNVTLDTVQETDPATGEERDVGQVGVYPAPVDVAYNPVGLAEATRIGWRRTVATTEIILGFLRDLFTGGVSPRSLGSIITIGQASGTAAAMGMEMFLSFMALFSINLAVLNLLPIPILDGGHLVFLTIEAVRGKALSVEQRMRWSQLGLIVILGIMVLALSNDILRLFGM